jgi:hypothetical protein
MWRIYSNPDPHGEKNKISYIPQPHTHPFLLLMDEIIFYNSNIFVTVVLIGEKQN